MAFDVAKGFLLIGILLTAEVLGTLPVVRATLERSGWARLATASAMLWCIALFGTFAGTRFIYFQF
jgi:hypothetical protein